MADILSCKQIVTAIGENLETRISALKAQEVNPTLAVVRVGNRPDDLSYERSAAKRAESLGITFKSIVLAGGSTSEDTATTDETATTEELLDTIRSINADNSIHGCLLLRPLPKGIDETRLCNMLVPEKDIDGISRASLAGVFTGADCGFPPATAQACLEMLDGYHIPLEGKQVVVVGRSLVVGRPVAMMLLARNATVTMCHSKTVDLSSVTRQADIVVCATGRARAFDEAYFKAGQIVLDVGINVDSEGNLCGDVDFDAVEPIVGAITPVPGGLGSVTTSVTMKHVVQAAEALLRG